MPTQEHLSDDYVASLLAKDAKTSNAKYSAYGFQDLLPKRPTYNAPKPNTRFLKNIIKETDSHNAALRAKEVSDSRARLRKLRDSSATPSSYESGYGRLSREDDPPRKRRRVERPTYEEDKLSRDYGRLKSRRDSLEEPRGHRRHRDDPADSEEDKLGHSRHSRKHDHHKSRRRRSRSRSTEGHRKSRYKGRSPRLSDESRSRSPRPEKRRHHHRSHRRDRSKSKTNGKDDENEKEDHLAKSKSNGNQQTSNPTPNDPNPHTTRPPSQASDSDPLEALIGPTPPSPPPKIRPRGRGTFASTSAMDTHFSTHYDPTIDVQPDAEIDDDWDMALEALRDRQKWQKQGAERLKAAGFTEEEVEKWEKGGEKREEDVRWKGRGEGREWDRGKVVGEDGVETVVEWGRLKGT